MSFSGIPSIPYISNSMSVLPGIAFGTLSIVSLWTWNTQKDETRQNKYIHCCLHEDNFDMNVPRTMTLETLQVNAFSGLNGGKATYLHAMDSQTRTSVQLLVANVALKMLCLLMLNEDLFIVKVPVTVPLVIRQGLISNQENKPNNKKIHHTELKFTKINIRNPGYQWQRRPCCKTG